MSADEFLPPGRASLSKLLYRDATQAVFSEGPARRCRRPVERSKRLVVATVHTSSVLRADDREAACTKFLERFDGGV